MWGKLNWFLLVFCATNALAKDTELMLYRPMTATENHPITKVTSQVTGECWQQSQLIKREDAWRCISAGKIYDPCFVKPFGRHLDGYCLSSPWATGALQIHVREPLNNQQHVVLDMSKAFPWAVELVNGIKCWAVEPSARYDGLPIHYRCENNTELFGDIHRCSTTWTMLQHGLSDVASIEIAKAWF